jgi:hypothetical protein
LPSVACALCAKHIGVEAGRRMAAYSNGSFERTPWPLPRRGSKADVGAITAHVRFVPGADIRRQVTPEYHWAQTNEQMAGRKLGPLGQFVFAAKPLSDFPDPVSAIGSNTRAVTFHGNIPKSANPARDGNSFNAAAHRILA